MAKSRKSIMGAPEVPPAKAIDLLKRQIGRGREVQKGRPVDSNEFDNWEHITSAFIEKAFGKESPNKTKFDDIGRIMAFTSDTPDSWFDERRAEALQHKIRFLDTLIELLRTEIDLDDEGGIGPP